MMTKKDYELIARALRHSAPPVDLPQKNEQWEDDIDSLVEVLKGDNIRFDSEKFYRACGVEA